MVIDASWIDRWVLFAMAKAGPPGPITNRNLYSRVVPAFTDDDGVGSTSGRCKRESRTKASFYSTHDRSRGCYYVFDTLVDQTTICVVNG